MIKYKKSRLGICSAMAALCVLFSGTSNAATDVFDSFQSKITITSSCTIISASALDFGSKGSLAIAIEQTSLITVNCTNTAPYTIALDGGTGGGNTTTRKMKRTNGSETIDYKIFRDTDRTVNWGNSPGTGTNGVVSGTGNGENQVHSVYGRVLSSPTTPASGDYTDTLTVTLNY